MPKLIKKTVASLEINIVEGDPSGPYILLLHGFGADGLDLAGLYQDIPLLLKPTWIFPTAPLRIPIGYNSFGHAWFPLDLSQLTQGEKVDLNQIFPNDLSEPRKMIEALIETLEIPLQKMVIGGFSQGAILSIDFALHQLHSVAGIAILSGALILQNSWEKLAPLHKGISFFQSHGLTDPLLSFEEAKKLYSFLTHFGLTGQFVSFQGGHFIPSQVQSKLNIFFEEMLS